MDPRLQALAAQFRLHDRLVIFALEGMTNETAQERLTDSTNHATFLLAHLVGARRFLMSLLGRKMADPFPELAEARSVDDVDEWPSLKALVHAWHDTAEPVQQALAGVNESELTAAAPMPFPMDDSSVLAGVAFLSHHEAYHVGQLAFLRKAAGLPAMKYHRDTAGATDDSGNDDGGVEDSGVEDGES